MAKVKAVTVGLVWLLSLIATTPTTASTDEVKWSQVNIPAEGKTGGWVLAWGSDVQHLVRAIDGTLYAYGKGLDYTLYKSSDGGYRWSYTGKVKDAIVDIAVAPNNAKILYYATSSQVYRSNDAGASFTTLAGNPGGAGSNNREITAIDVSTIGGKNIIAVGTRDKDSSQFGGVYLLDESQPHAGWIDTKIGSHDVYAVAFSPNFASDEQLLAVITDETDTWIIAKIESGGWGKTVGTARLSKNNSGGAVAVATSAAIAFPNDYQIAGMYFVAIDSGNEAGDVYMITGAEVPGNSVATDLNIGATYRLNNVDVTGLAVAGNASSARLLAGSAGGQVYFSNDGGSSWKRGTKPPTGSKTYVLMAPDFSTSGRAYAATGGQESAFSFTMDGGATWSQIALIDTKITTIIDLAVSPDYEADETLFMLTWGGEHSLWRSRDGGRKWERVFTSALAEVDQIDRVALSPQYGRSSQVVFIAGSSNGSPATWKSSDSGERFSFRPAPLAIDIWAIAGDNALFIGSYDGSNGLVYRTANGGLSYTSEVAGSQSLYSLALSPDYSKDKTVLVGNTNGWVYWSNDNGVSFEPLPPQATLPPLTGVIVVAFDPKFSSNNTVYAASDTPGDGIYRFIIGSSTKWESIDSPEDGIIAQVRVAADGTMYAANSKVDGGMERGLNPTYSLGPTFETVTRGLDTGATLTGLWVYKNRLWTNDTTNNRLLSYNDTLTVPVSLTSPPDKAPGIGIITDKDVRQVNLDWETLKGATKYEWQADYDTNFASVPTGFKGTTEASSARLPPLEPATKYYWRARATEPVLSPWAEKWSFMTSLGTEAMAPRLYSPEAGTSNIAVRPLFQWSAIAGAESYELLVSREPSFAKPAIAKNPLPATAWQSDLNLEHSTTYYWKVRAVGLESSSAWSAVGVFTTKSPPPPEVSPPPPPAPPAPPQQSTTPDWARWLIYLGSALLLTFVGILITLVILITRTRRL